MIGRVRGEHDARAGWRFRVPSSPVAAAAEQHEHREDELEAGLTPAEACDRTGSLQAAMDRPRPGWLRRFWLIVACLAVGYAAISDRTHSAPPPRRSALGLPASPRAWLDAYEAAAVDNPGRVCAQLFSAALAGAYGRAVHGSCMTYFRRINSSSLTVRRIYRDGPTAVLELRQTLSRVDWAVVLSRQRTGWRAVDLLAGDLLL